MIAFALLSGCDGGRNNHSSVTGQIEVKGVSPGSRIGGRVVEVRVKEGDAVQPGDLLVLLDDAEAKAAVAAAEANLARAEATLQKLENGATAEQLRQAEAAARAAEEQFKLAEKGARSQEIRAARALVDGAQAQFDAARIDYERLERLRSEQVTAERLYDQAKAAFEGAQAQLTAAKERYQIALDGARDEEVAMAKANFDRAQALLDEVRTGAREEDRAMARAAMAAARADLDRAQSVLAEMQIAAPMPGVVESIDLKPGDLVRPGPVARIINPEDLELTVYVSAALLGHIVLGEKIPLTTDSHGAARFEGRITFIAAEGEFTPRNLQTEEERVQQVFAVKLALDSAGGQLRAGMAATAHFPRSPESAAP